MTERRRVKRAEKEEEYEPRTPFQAWLKPALKRNGLSIAELARRVNMDYPGLWKIARGNPETYSASTRPDYENTFAIGEALGDVEGALRAAGYPLPPHEPQPPVIFEAPNGKRFKLVYRDPNDTVKLTETEKQILTLFSLIEPTGEEKGPEEPG